MISDADKGSANRGEIKFDHRIGDQEFGHADFRKIGSGATINVEGRDQLRLFDAQTLADASRSLRSRALETMIDELLVIQEGTRLGVEVGDEDVDRAPQALAGAAERFCGAFGAGLQLAGIWKELVDRERSLRLARSLDMGRDAEPARSQKRRAPAVAEPIAQARYDVGKRAR
mgnify:CR=1 FL=1